MQSLSQRFLIGFLAIAILGNALKLAIPGASRAKARSAARAATVQRYSMLAIYTAVRE